MAIIRLDCNLNGGDSVTPNNELFYRIYGDVDAYTTPIHTTGTALSDANVTVDNDTVIITGIDGTTNTEFKIASVDLAGNEGVLSDAVSSGWDLANASYLQSSNVSASSTQPSGVWFSNDGMFCYYLSTSSKVLRRSSLTVAWDISSMGAASQTLSAVFDGSSGASVVFNNDGDKLYINAGGDKTVNQFDLATPWNITTAGGRIDSSVYTGAANQGIFISADGTKLIMCVWGVGSLETYTLGTPWDITTMGTSPTATKTLAESSVVYGIAFNEGGTRAVITTQNGIFYEYTLSTAWDITTMIYTGTNLDVSSQDANMRAIFINKNGDKIYGGGITAAAHIYEYDL